MATSVFAFKTFSELALRSLSSLSARVSSLSDKISMASNAALEEPSMPTVATGMPEGICTVERSASIPPKGEAFTGMPITGMVVLAAIAPAKR